MMRPHNGRRDPASYVQLGGELKKRQFAHVSSARRNAGYSYFIISCLHIPLIANPAIRKLEMPFWLL